MNRDWEPNAAALRGCLYGIIVAVLLWFAWPEAPEPEPGYVTIARHDVARLRALRSAAHAASAATRPAVVQGRAQVITVRPGVLQVTLTPTTPPETLAVPVVVTAALEAERARVRALEAELAAADSLIAAQDTLAAAQDRQLAEIRHRDRWRQVKALAKGAALGALAAFTLSAIR